MKDIDTRRYANRIRDAYTLTEAEGFLKDFARGCIEAVTPERITGRDLVAVKGSPDFTRHAAVSNIILDLVEQKTKKLLGDKK